MPDWPSALAGSRVSLLSTVGGNGFTAGSSANTKSSWAALDSSLDFDVDGILLTIHGGSVLADFLVDIGIGAAASEVVIVSNLLFSGGSGSAWPNSAQAYVPLPLPAGTRLSARVQSTTGSAQLTMSAHGCAGPWFAALRKGRATTYGAITADSGGVAVDPGGTINTKGAWAQLSAGIANPIDYAIVCVGGQANSARTDAVASLDLGVGAGGSEQVFVSDLMLRYSALLDQITPLWMGLPVSVKGGQRLGARAQCSINDATDRLMDVVVIGFD